MLKWADFVKLAGGGSTVAIERRRSEQYRKKHPMKPIFPSASGTSTTTPKPPEAPTAQEISTNPPSTTTPTAPKAPTTQQPRSSIGQPTNSLMGNHSNANVGGISNPAPNQPSQSPRAGSSVSSYSNDEPSSHAAYWYSQEPVQPQQQVPGASNQTPATAQSPTTPTTPKSKPVPDPYPTTIGVGQSWNDVLGGANVNLQDDSWLPGDNGIWLGNAGAPKYTQPASAQTYSETAQTEQQPPASPSDSAAQASPDQDEPVGAIDQASPEPATAVYEQEAAAAPAPAPETEQQVQEAQQADGMQQEMQGEPQTSYVPASVEDLSFRFARPLDGTQYRYALDETKQSWRSLQKLYRLQQLGGVYNQNDYAAAQDALNELQDNYSRLEQLAASGNQQAQQELQQLQTYLGGAQGGDAKRSADTRMWTPTQEAGKQPEQNADQTFDPATYQPKTPYWADNNKKMTLSERRQAARFAPKNPPRVPLSEETLPQYLDYINKNIEYEKLYPHAVPNPTASWRAVADRVERSMRQAGMDTRQFDEWRRLGYIR